MAGIEVRPVKGRRDLDRFIAMPRLVYRDDPNWIAPLPMERKDVLKPGRNPYFQHAEAQLFLAFDGDACVGRISAQIDRLSLERYRDRTGQFGFLEAVDDRAVFSALLGQAERWLAERGMTRVRGPFSFSINEETGLLVDGFDTPPRLMMGHARPYYAARLEELGYAKAKDIIAYDYALDTPFPRKMALVLKRVLRSGDIRVRPISKRHLERDLDIIISIFNDAWSDNWGFVPMTDAEIKHLGKNLKLLVTEGYIAIAEIQGRPAAMAVTLPDVNDWIADLDGRLLPFGWAKLLYRFMTPPKAARLPLMGVRKSYQGTPMGTALALAVIEAVRVYHAARGLERAELSWILEDNVSMRRIIEELDAHPYKTYRIYERSLPRDPSA